MFILTSLYLIMNTKNNDYNQICFSSELSFLSLLNSALSRRNILEDLMLDKNAQVIDKLNLTTLQ